MELWERKLKECFGSAVVDKPKAINNEMPGLPRYVSEYLLGFFCEGEITKENLKETNDYIHNHRIDAREKEVFKKNLLLEGSLKLIDKFKVKINLTKKKEDTIQMEIPSLGISDAKVSSDILQSNDRLLIDGLWGMGEIVYSEDNKQIQLEKFKPFQLSEIDLEELIEMREQFSSDQWLNIMVSTVGLNYENYNRRQKLILLSRLIPMVENNIFMMEFGRPGTGKTYAYENISSYSRVISGSQVTEAQLFYNLTTKQDGLLVQYDVLLFDEIDKIKKSGIDEKVKNKLYQYLASGKFDRGEVEKVSECGIMMVGNLPPGGFSEEELLEKLLHSSITHSAFLDRLAGVVPGWELESLKDRRKAYTKHYGFAADYFSEIIHKLRKKNYNYVLNRICLEGTTIRDADAINKIISGMIKLVYPNGELTDEELKEIVDIAISYRQFVIKQNFMINKDPELNRDIKYSIYE